MQVDETTATAEAGSTLTSERRRSPRTRRPAPAWLSTQAGALGTGHDVIVADLSLHGVGFACQESLYVGAVHWIVIRSGGLCASSRIRVVYCRQRDDGNYDIGGEFF